MTTMIPRTAPSTPELTRARIASRIEIDQNGCWIWLGSRKPNGYGEMTIRQRRQYAHRVSYEIHVGPIPIGLTIDHLCRVPACVNPAHLEPVTQRENNLRSTGPAVQRARHAAVTHCRQGHEYSPENTWRDKANKRHCRACHNARQRARRARERAS